MILVKFDNIKVNKLFYFKMLNVGGDMLKSVKYSYFELI